MRTIIKCNSLEEIEMTHRAAVAAVGTLLIFAGCVSACGSSGSSSTAGATVSVVASTDVWGSVAAAIGGSKVTVTSIISDPTADPHSYEVSPQNQLAVSKAKLVIENGGGYDDFVPKMLASAGSKAVVVNAAKLSGYTASAGAFLNEHFWYDLPTVLQVAQMIETSLTAIDPANAATYAANTNTFVAKVGELQGQESALKAKAAGAGVAITEAVPLYMLSASGLVNETPPAFSEAVESGTDAPATVVAATLALFTGRQVKALVYNKQTTGPQTEQVLAAAKANGIPVVPVTETLPAGTDYVSWMGANIGAISKAVAP